MTSRHSATRVRGLLGASMGCLLGGESHSRNRYSRSIYRSHGHLKPAAVAAVRAGFFWLLTGTFSDDDLWQKLSQGGAEVACGWLTDKFGVSWQIVPVAIGEMMSSPDKAAAQRAFAAMMDMKKLDIAALRRAYQGVGASAEAAA